LILHNTTHVYIYLKLFKILSNRGFIFLGGITIKRPEYIFWNRLIFDGGDTIWAGKITAGEKIKIECKTGSIQYSYKIREDQPIPENESTSCDENEEIQLP
jgi:hypothetical protein